MITELNKQIEDSYYWDARVKALDCNYFGDEVKLVFEDDDETDIVYHFEGCYKIKIEHYLQYAKNMPYRELARAQIPYFMQDVELKEVKANDKTYLEFTINMYPIDLYVLCEKFTITRA